MRTITGIAALAGALLLAGCGTAHQAHTSTTGTRAATPAAATIPAAGQGPVPAVPGTNNNKYVAGPFTVTMTAGMVKLPSRFDAVTETGQDIPEYGSVIVVKNTSADFTGWVGPQVEYVKGHSIRGLVIDTETADPYAGSDGGRSDTLAPGQSETLYAQYQGDYRGGYVDAQLTAVSYGTADVGTIDASTIDLKY